MTTGRLPEVHTLLPCCIKCGGDEFRFDGKRQSFKPGEVVLVRYATCQDCETRQKIFFHRPPHGHMPEAGSV